MNSNFRNVDIKRAVSKYVGITPFDDTILDVVKGLSNKEVSNDESLKRVYWSDVTMFKQHFLCRYPDIFIPNSNLKNLDQNSLLIFRIFSLQIDFSGRLTYIWVVSIYIHISIHSLLRRHQLLYIIFIPVGCWVRISEFWRYKRRWGKLCGSKSANVHNIISLTCTLIFASDINLDRRSHLLWKEINAHASTHTQHTHTYTHRSIVIKAVVRKYKDATKLQNLFPLPCAILFQQQNKNAVFLWTFSNLPL